MNAVTSAATGRIMANAGPSSEYVAAIESMPVCGVAIRNEVEAPREAPLRRSDTVVGSTPHDQSGSGTPMSAAFITDSIPGRERCLR